MGRVRRGGFILETWIGDHPPRHVHVFQDQRMIAKVELDEALSVMEGKMSRKLRKILGTLVREGAFS